MGAFVQIPDAFLASIASGCEAIPTLYFEGHPLSRRIFWQRLWSLHGLAERFADSSLSCLDFGCGGGVLLPTLSRMFPRAVGVDLEITEATKVIGHFSLENVVLVRADVGRDPFVAGSFGTAFAADVLEHFESLEVPVGALRRWLRPGGVLLTSLPTENALYRLLRKLFGIAKPDDHYHSGAEVEAFLAAHGFERLARRWVPLGLPILPLFLVSAWRRR